MRRQSIALVAASALFAGCIFPPPPPSYPVVVAGPPSFDQSWDAAVGAAQDAGIELTQADRSLGRITGTKAGAAVTIELKQMPDRSLHVSFSAPDSKEVNPKLGERWLSAYNRRMGR
jgi:hypothetical protein